MQKTYNPKMTNRNKNKNNPPTNNRNKMHKKQSKRYSYSSWLSIAQQKLVLPAKSG